MDHIHNKFLNNASQNKLMYYGQLTLGALAQAELKDGNLTYFYLLELHTNSKVGANYNFRTKNYYE